VSMAALTVPGEAGASETPKYTTLLPWTGNVLYSQTHKVCNTTHSFLCWPRPVHRAPLWLLQAQERSVVLQPAAGSSERQDAFLHSLAGAVG